MAKSYKEKLKGAANPNFRGLKDTYCALCGKKTNFRGVFCSNKCHADSRRKPRTEKPKQKADKPSQKIKEPKPRKNNKPHSPERKKKAIKGKAKRTCAYCAKEYFAYAKTRKFCSYPCFVESGGPIRAGVEAAKMTRKYGAKKDANHNEVASVFSAMAVPFYDLSSFGRGLPDGLAWVQNQWHLVEIKNPKTGYGRRGLNPIQTKWHSQARGGPIFIIKNVTDAENFAAGKFDEVEKQWPKVPARTGP